jgi:hypothetical protein
MNNDSHNEPSSHDAIREYLSRAAKETPSGKRLFFDRQTGKFVARDPYSNERIEPVVDAEDLTAFAHLFVTVADLAASGIVGSAAYALLTSTISRFRTRISKIRSGGVKSLREDEAEDLARGIIASRIDCNPYSLERISRLYNVDDKSWLISMSRNNIPYNVKIPFGDPEEVECLLSW